MKKVLVIISLVVLQQAIAQQKFSLIKDTIVCIPEYGGISWADSVLIKIKHNSKIEFFKSFHEPCTLSVGVPYRVRFFKIPFKDSVSFNEFARFLK